MAGLAVGIAFNGMLPASNIAGFGAAGAGIAAVPGSVYGGVNAVPLSASREIEALRAGKRDGSRAGRKPTRQTP